MYKDVREDSQLTQNFLEINILSVFKLEEVTSFLNLSVYGARQYLGAKNSFLKVEIDSHSNMK
jgi:hypothetical protein